MPAFRILSTAPLLSAAVVVLIAVAIAGTTLVQGVSEALLRRPFLAADPDRLYAVTRDVAGAPVSNALYEALRDDLSPNMTLASFAFSGAPVRAPGQPTESVATGQTSRNYFDVVRPPFVMGRGFSHEAGLPEVVISRALWTRAFASRPDVLGLTLDVFRQPLVIVGVLDGFTGTSVTYDAEVFHPFDLLPAMLGAEMGNGLIAPGTRLASVLARTSRTTPTDVINTQVRAADERLRVELGERRAVFDVPITVVPAAWTAVRGEERVQVLRLGSLAWWVSAGVFLLACVNASALVLARLERRRHMLAVRRALGATRGRLVLAGLAEIAVLASLGLLTGLLTAVAGAHLVNTSAWSLTAYTPLRVSLGGPVVPLAVLLAACAVIIAGLIPLWRLSGEDVTRLLGTGSTRTVMGGRLGWRRLLIGVQAAVSIALVVLTLVAVKGLRDAQSTDFGIEPHTLLRANVDASLPALHVDDVHAVFKRLRDRAADLPGVQVAGLADSPPLSGGVGRRPLVIDDEEITVHAVGAGVGYFETLGVPILAGVLPDETERDAVVISASLARELHARGGGIGSVLRIADDGPESGVVRVVGIVRDVQQAVPGQEALPVMYVRAEHETTRRSATLLLRTNDASAVHVEHVRQLVAELLPDVPVLALQWVSEPIRRWLMPVRMLSALLVASGAVALLLALSGVCALLLYIVSGRRREIGVRMALGATPGRAYLAVASGVAGAALGGIALGLISGWGASHMLAQAYVSVVPAEPFGLFVAGAFVVSLLVAGLLLPGALVRKIIPAHVMREE